MNSPTIRPIVSTDFDAWKELWDGYNAFYGRAGPTTLPAETTAATWSRFLDPSEPVHALVAEYSGQLVGIAHYLQHRSTNQVPPACYLQDLFTDPRTRGRGIGRPLIEASKPE